MDNKKNFILDSTAVKIKEILNKDFLSIEIYAIAEGENRNKSSFTLESMKDAIPTFFNKFILGYFNIEDKKNGTGEFEEHNSDIMYDTETEEFYWSYTAPNAEKALGMIRESDSVELVEYKGKNWLKTTAVILTKYNREAVKHLLKTRKIKVSVEITVLESHMEEDIEVIDKFVLDGITILGNMKNSNIAVEEGIEGASLKVLDFMNSNIFNSQRNALCFAYKQLEENISTETETENGNEIVPEINLSNESTDENVETNPSDNTEKDLILNSEQEFEFNDINNKEEGTQMLTYNQKREILEAKLVELLREEIEEDHCFYCYVCDMTDEVVIFTFEEKTYMANYTIDEERNSNIDLENKVEVMRSWEPKPSEAKFLVDEEEYSLEELGEKYMALREEYKAKEEELNGELENVKKDFEAVSTELETIKKDIFEKEIEEMIKNACKMVDDEDELEDEEDDEIKETIKNIVSEKCHANEFANAEEVNSFVEVELAKAVYKKVKNNRETESKRADFSAPIEAPVAPVVEKTDSLVALKEATKKAKQTVK